MADQQGAKGPRPEAAALSRSMAEIGERTQQLLTEWLTRRGPLAPSTVTEPLDIAGSFVELAARMMSSPGRILEAQRSLWGDFMALWQSTALRMLGQETTPIVQPSIGDVRFHDRLWEDSDVFSYIMQSYLLTARWLEQTVRDVEDLSPKTRDKVETYTHQFINALSPTNFAFTNPEVIRATIESGGENLINGLANLLADLERWQSTAARTASSQGGARVGKRFATTRGKVIYRNALMELIQYEPRTPKVLKRPLLFVPAWINRYYLFDLRPNNSWVRWALERGHTVFMISWVNPDDRLAEMSFADYVLEGPVAALDVIGEATGEEAVNAVGFCIGGTLLVAALGYLADIGDRRIASATLLAAMIDFSEPGQLSTTIDEATLSYLQDMIAEYGYIDAREMASTFRKLREGDLIWSFVVNNYLLGKDPFPYDLLRWNADPTRMPHAAHTSYILDICRKNQLVEPGGVTIAGKAVDVHEIDVPAYVLAAREDLIAPWRSVYRGTQILSGPVRFALTASGHVSGVVNPPSARKYLYWCAEEQPPKDPERWLAHALEHRGSWWTHWDSWIKDVSGQERVPAREPGGGRVKPLAEAPGTYALR